MRKFLSLLRNRFVVLAFGFVLLMLLVWFAGPLVGLEGVVLRLLVMALFVLTGVIVYLIQQMRAAKGAALIEKTLKQQAESQISRERPDRQDRAQALKDRLDEAINTLRKTRKGRFGWRGTALYELPWYMMIGPPASGKSTAILHSGLTFPYSAESGGRIQGVGGTRNCDWWFAKEAVLLDTAGRYTTEEEDKEEWLGFLDLLKKARKKKPINGVIVGISVSDLLNGDVEACEEYGKKVRTRIDELIRRLSIRFPVYVVFTKCDLIQGFVEFFGDMSAEERAQVWGATFSEVQIGQTPAVQLFEGEFARLSRSLNANCLGRMGYEIRTANKQAIYFFPMQFSSIHERLSRFLGALFDPNPYQEQTIFRGFYFTSGTQEGTPIDNVIGAMTRAFGIVGGVTASSEEKTEPKSYFLKNLFTEIVFPDQNMARLTSAAEVRGRLLRWGAWAGSAVLSSLLIVSMVISFLGNKRLISQVGSAARNVAGINWLDGGAFPRNVEQMEEMHELLVKLGEYDVDGPPLRLRWGLYRGTDIEEPARQVFLKQAFEGLIRPVSFEMEATLTEMGRKGVSDMTDYGRSYDILKAYMMLADPEKGDADFLERVVGSVLEGQPALRENEPLLHDLLGQSVYYFQHYGEESAPRITPDMGLVTSVRRALRKIPTVERLFYSLKNEGDRRFEPYNLFRALEGQRQSLITSDYRVSGVFTPQGWNDYFKDAITQAGVAALKEDWILGEGDEAGTVDATAFETPLKRLYMNQYVKEYGSFLNSLRVVPFEGLSDAVQRMQDLAGARSPILVVLESVTGQLDIDRSTAEKVVSSSGGFFDAARRRLGIQNNTEETETEATSRNLVEREFAGLRRFVRGPEAGGESANPDVNAYIAELGAVFDLLNEIGGADDPGAEAARLAGKVLSGSTDQSLLTSARNVGKLVGTFGVYERKSVEPLLYQPIANSWAAVLASASARVNEEWRSTVVQPYRNSLQNKYPFDSSGQDATLYDVADFFHPTNGLFWRFFQERLKPFLNDSGTAWEVKTWQGRGFPVSGTFLSTLKQARLITDSLFPRGTSEPKVEFEVYPLPSAGLSETMLTVDGQSYRYRMGPQIFQRMRWPNDTGPSGGKIYVANERSGFREQKSFEGRWGFFKLLDAARVTARSSTQYELEWIFDTPKGKFRARFDLKAASYKNPFVRGFFDRFQCPESVSG